MYHTPLWGRLAGAVLAGWGQFMMGVLGLHMAVVVKNRVTQKWLAPPNGNMDIQTCGPIPGGLILTHTHIWATPQKEIPKGGV